MLSQTAQGILINGTGRDGEDGQNGEKLLERSFFSFSMNRDGKSGNDATQPTDGDNGGHVTMHLQRTSEPLPSGERSFREVKKFEAQPVSVQISGKIVSERAEYYEFANPYVLQPNQSISIIANGGSGGCGANGSDGQDGREGFPGWDASDFRNAERGGEGGNGGNAGAGSSGGNAGNGGKVFVQVHERNTNLLMLLGDVACNPGEPGPPGRHGKPGKGGPGGSGGKGYDRTIATTAHQPATLYPHRPFCPHSNSLFYNYCHCDRHVAVTTSSVRTDHRPAAADGPPGRNGQEPSFVPHWGERGIQGLFRIVVYDDFNQSTEYDGVYKLEFVACKIQSPPNQSPFHPEYDGVYESEELLLVQEVTLKNTGKMPTPSQTNIFVYLAENENIRLVNPDASYLQCPLAIAPGAEVKLSGGIMFQLLLPTNNRCPGTKTIPLQLFSYVEGTSRGFSRFSREPSIQLLMSEVVQFVPQNMNSSVNLCVGQWKEYCMHFQNNSIFNVGYDSALRRTVEVCLRFKGGKIPCQNIFISTEEEPTNFVQLNESFTFNISSLSAAQNTSSSVKKVKFWMMVNGVVPYIEANLEFDLLIQTLSGNSKKLIQTFPWSIRSTQKYRKLENSTFLLVASHKNSYEEISYWCQLGEWFSQVVNIWDLDQEGHFSLSQPLPETGVSLGEEWRGKFIVILCPPSSGRGLGGYLSQADFLRWKGLINFYFYAPADFNFSWLIYWTFPIKYEVLHQTDRRQVINTLELNPFFKKSIQFRIKRGCLACCQSSESAISSINVEFSKKMLKIPSLANVKFVLVYEAQKKDIIVDFIPIGEYPTCRGSDFSWLSIQHASTPSSIQGTQNVRQFLSCIPFATRVLAVQARLAQWSTSGFEAHDRCLLQSLTIDLVYECHHVFRHLPTVALKNPQHWIDKLANMLLFLSLDSHLASLYYQKNAFWSSLASCIVQYLAGVKYCTNLVARRDGAKSKYKSAFYRCIEAKVLERLGAFICPDMKESTKQFVSDFVSNAVDTKLSGCVYLDSFEQRLIDPFFVTSLQSGCESELWTKEKDVQIEKKLYERLQAEFP